MYIYIYVYIYIYTIVTSKLIIVTSKLIVWIYPPPLRKKVGLLLGGIRV